MALITATKGDIVSFQLVMNGINGGERVEVRVTAGEMDYSTARMIDNQLNVKHAALFPYFKDAVGGVNDPSAYDYITVIGQNGVTEVIGIPWIEPSTWSVIQSRRANLNISNWREDFRGPLSTFLRNLGAVWTLNIFDN